jgi:hypothetical protein
MGNSSSSQVTETVSVVTNLMTTIISNTYNSSSNNFQSTNNQQVQLVNSNCTNITETNTTRVVFNVTTYFSSNNTDQMIADLQNAIQQATSSTNTQVASFLSTAFQNNNQSTTVSQYLQTNVNTLVSNSTFSSCSNNAILTNAQSITLVNSTGEFCTLTNDTQFQFAAQCTINSITSATSNSTILNTAAQQATDSNTQTTAGVSQAITAVGDAIDSALSALTSPIVIFCIVIALGFLVVLFWFVFGGHRTSTTSSTPLINSGTTAATTVSQINPATSAALQTELTNLLAKQTV